MYLGRHYDSNLERFWSHRAKFEQILEITISVAVNSQKYSAVRVVSFHISVVDDFENSFLVYLASVEEGTIRNCRKVSAIEIFSVKFIPK
jgi:L-asparaginase/Glu-tRNA(Gln) amidotransferase subunit D